METKKLKIERLFVFVATDENGKEWLPSIEHDAGFFFPMLGADRETIEKFREDAHLVSQVKGHKITLVEFSVRKDLEIIHKLN